MLHQFLISIVALLLFVFAAQNAGASDSVTSMSIGKKIELTQVFPPERIRTETRDLYDFVYVDETRGELNNISRFIDAARREAASAVNDAFLIRTEVMLVPDAQTLTALVGDWAINSTAVAVSPTRQIIINCDATRKLPNGEIMRTLTHEFAHLYIAIRIWDTIPRWLNEGLAMKIAGNGSLEDSAILAGAFLTRTTIPLRELEHEMPVDASRQRLAYAQAQSVTDYVIRNQFHGSTGALIQHLGGAQGISHVSMFFTKEYRDSIEDAWIADNSGLKALAGVTHHDSVYWLITLVLCLIAWAVIIRKRRKQREIWKFEEHQRAARKLLLANLKAEDNKTEEDNETDTEEDHPEDSPEEPKTTPLCL